MSTIQLSSCRPGQTLLIGARKNENWVYLVVKHPLYGWNLAINFFPCWQQKLREDFVQKTDFVLNKLNVHFQKPLKVTFAPSCMFVLVLVYWAFPVYKPLFFDADKRPCLGFGLDVSWHFPKTFGDCPGGLLEPGICGMHHLLVAVSLSQRLNHSCLHFDADKRPCLCFGFAPSPKTRTGFDSVLIAF